MSKHEAIDDWEAVDDWKTVWEKTPTEVPPEEVVESPDQAEAILQGLSKGVTLGASGPIAGGFEAAGAALGLSGVGGPVSDISLSEEGPTLSKDKLLEAYRRGKGEQVGREVSAEKEFPKSFLASEVAGGFATPIPGAALAKGGKIGQLASKVLPNLSGIEKIAKTGKLAKKAKKLDDFRRYKQLVSAQKAQSLAFATKEGVKAGAIVGLATGESEITEGDTSGVLKDAVVGGTLGAAFGAGLVGGTQLVQGVVSKIPGIKGAVDSFSFGTKGVSLDNDITNQKIATASRSFVKSLDDKLSSLGMSKKKILGMIDDAGITINTKDDLVKARDAVKGIDSPTDRADAQKFIDVLDDYIGDGKETKKALARLEKDIIKSGLKDPEKQANFVLNKKALEKAVTENQSKTSPLQGVVSDVEGIPGGIQAAVRQDGDEIMAKAFAKPRSSNIKKSVDAGTGREVLSVEDLTSGQIKAIVSDVPSSLNAESLTTTQASKLQDLLNRYSSIAKKENLPTEVKRSATEAAVAIKNKLSGAAREIKEPLDNVNKQITSLLTAKEQLVLKRNTSREIDKLANEQKLAKFIAGVGDNNPLSNKSIVMKQLRKADPTMADAINKEVTELRTLYNLSAKVDKVPDSTSIQSIAGTAQSIVNRISNTLGQVVSAPARASKKVAKAAVTKILPKTQLANKSLDLIESSPEKIQGIVNKINESGSASDKLFAEPLSKAVNNKERSRQAILFGLYQQPAFREMMEKFTKENEE